MTNLSINVQIVINVQENSYITEMSTSFTVFEMHSPSFSMMYTLSEKKLIVVAMAYCNLLKTLRELFPGHDPWILDRCAKNEPK